MSKTIDELKALANQVKNATVPGENTAERIGGLFVDIINYIAGERPGPTPTPTNKTIYYGFAARNGKEDFFDMDSVEKGDSDTIKITPHCYTEGDSFYVAVPSSMVASVSTGVLPVPMKSPVTHVVDNKSYDFYETAEEGGFEEGDYELTITVNNK